MGGSQLIPKVNLLGFGLGLKSVLGLRVRLALEMSWLGEESTLNLSDSSILYLK